MFECIPNISEGRDGQIIEAAKQAISSVVGVKLLHTDIGYDANRTVFTFIGEAAGIESAILALYEVCLSRIDLRVHVGEHPRMGAVDVCPIVPLLDNNVESGINLSKKVGNTIAERFQIPVFLYELSQPREYRKKLSLIRRGQFEGLPVKLGSKEWFPDFGPSSVHPTFGATVIGARDFLIAFNVSLDCLDVNLVKAIAKRLRDYRSDSDQAVSEKWFGVRAIGWSMPKYNCVQVSTNIVDSSRISLADVYLEIERLAKEHNVGILGSELIGLVPIKALHDAASKFGGEKNDEGVDLVIKKLNLNCHSYFDPVDRILESHF